MDKVRSGKMEPSNVAKNFGLESRMQQSTSMNSGYGGSR